MWNFYHLQLLKQILKYLFLYIWSCALKVNKLVNKTGMDMEKNKNFNINLTENERKTIASLVKIENGVVRPDVKALNEICKEAKIKHRGYQHKLLKKLIGNGIVEKDKDKKYRIKHKYLTFVSNFLIQKKIKDLEKTEVFTYLDSTVFGIKNKWLKYPEMHIFHESLENAISGLYTIKMIKKIFLLRDFSVNWKSFLDTDIPLQIKYEIWLKIPDMLSIFDQENKDRFLERETDFLKTIGMPKKKIEDYSKEINKQHKDFIVEFRKKIGYTPKKYKPKKIEVDNEVLKSVINKKLNIKQKKQAINVLDWGLDVYPKEIKDTGFFLDLGNLDSHTGFHFQIPVDDEEKTFRNIEDIAYFLRIDTVFNNLKKNTIGKSDEQGFKTPIDNTLIDMIDIWNERNQSRLMDRFVLLYVKLIKKPFIQTFYKQLDKKSRVEIISILKENKHYSKGKSDYEIFYDYASCYL